jgi:predicted Zn-dependent protease
MVPSNSIKSAAIAAASAACMLLALSPIQTLGQNTPKPPPEDSEVKMGREAAVDTDKELKLITDPAVLDRVNRIGQELAAIANSTQIPAKWGDSKVKKFNYTFKVVDDKDVNAFSLPGGFIYVNKGLLDYVHSDDELAGVLAHEIAHAAHHHMVKLVREQSKMQNVLIPLVIAAAVGGKGNGNTVGGAMMAGQLYMTAKLNGYGVEAEKDADYSGMVYLSKTKYSPVGLLTFMERLATDEQRSPDHPLGIYRTHPPSPERAQAALDHLEDLHIAVNRRAADPKMRAVVTVTNVGGRPTAEVKMYKTVIARLVTDDSLSAEERGKKLAKDLDTLFDQGLKMYEVRPTPDKSKIIARFQTLVTYTPSDAAALGKPVSALTDDTLEAIKTVLWQEQVNRPSSGVDISK